MAKLQTNHVKISGVCGALPETAKTVYEVGAGYFDDEEIRKTAAPIGADRLYFAAEEQTASDLCFAAAERLIEKLGWERSEIDGLIFVSQTHDYAAPATACLLQHRLGLPKGCLAFDMDFGCSAFVNAWLLAANLIETGVCKKMLILIGDTLRKHLDPADRGLTFIISDAGSATAVEHTGETSPAASIIKTDGSGKDALFMPHGGVFRMDGMAVFTFVVREVPVLLGELAALHGKGKDGFDYFIFHQANTYMLKYVAKRAKIPMDKVPINIGRYGNTNGSTIPFLLCDLAAGELAAPRDVMMVGFGVGLSWGGIATSVGALGCAEVITVCAADKGLADGSVIAGATGDE